jgi:hypothetical protein
MLFKSYLEREGKPKQIGVHPIKIFFWLEHISEAMGCAKPTRQLAPESVNCGYQPQRRATQSLATLAL